MAVDEEKKTNELPPSMAIDMQDFHCLSLWSAEEILITVDGIDKRDEEIMQTQQLFNDFTNKCGHGTLFAKSVNIKSVIIDTAVTNSI